MKFSQTAVNAINTAVNKIFIRKDLNTESGMIPNPFCPSELGLQFLNKRIGKLLVISKHNRCLKCVKIKIF